MESIAHRKDLQLGKVVTTLVSQLCQSLANRQLNWNRGGTLWLHNWIDEEKTRESLEIDSEIYPSKIYFKILTPRVTTIRGT